MTDTKHSPLPWRVLETSPESILDATGRFIGFAADADGGAETADRIVRAVNAHAALVEALQSVYAEDRANHDGVMQPHATHLSLHCLATVIAALAKADGKE